MDNDFYSSLYTWFDRCGIISDVRTHLRYNLFKLLKTKDVTFSKVKNFSHSPKQYVYDLLIADYLWNHEYDYTLSVFASEVPMLAHHTHQLITTYQNNTQETSSKRKLQTDYVSHTLETLGIQPNEPVGESIISEYINNDVSLLFSILKYRSQPKLSNDTVVLQKVPCVCEKTNGTQIGLSRKNDMVDDILDKLLSQKNVFDEQLIKKKNELNKYSCTVGQQMEAINDKLSQVQTLIDKVNLKKKKFYQDKNKTEHRIQIKKFELSVKENSLYQKAKKLQMQWNKYTQFETNLKELKDELTKLKTKEQLKSPSDIKTIETSIQTDECYFSEEAINYSNGINTQELQMIIKDQQLRIEKLTIRVMSLSQQIEAQFLKNLTNEVSGPTTHTQWLPKNICDSSLTDDIIQDAKNRLKRLKEETIKADQRYFNSIVSLPL